MHLGGERLLEPFHLVERLLEPRLGLCPGLVLVVALNIEQLRRAGHVLEALMSERQRMIRNA